MGSAASLGCLPVLERENVVPKKAFKKVPKKDAVPSLGNLAADLKKTIKRVAR